MNKLREAAEKALEALEYHQEQTRPIYKTQETIVTLRQALAEKHECETCAAKRKKLTDAGLSKSPLRQALAQPEQGCAECGKKASDGWALYCVKCMEQEPVWCECGDGIVANDEAKCGVCVMQLENQIERLKSQPEQEPVAWVRDLTSPSTHCVTSLKYMSIADTDAGVAYIPVYTAPPSKPDVNQELLEAAEYALRSLSYEEADKLRAAVAKHKEQE